jgi:hypothetical protein
VIACLGLNKIFFPGACFKAGKLIVRPQIKKNDDDTTLEATEKDT